jgi:hypothetical protein
MVSAVPSRLRSSHSNASSSASSRRQLGRSMSPVVTFKQVEVTVPVKQTVQVLRDMGVLSGRLSSVSSKASRRKDGTHTPSRHNVGSSHESQFGSVTRSSLSHYPSISETGGHSTVRNGSNHSNASFSSHRDAPTVHSIQERGLVRYSEPTIPCSTPSASSIPCYPLPDSASIYPWIPGFPQPGGYAVQPGWAAHQQRGVFPQVVIYTPGGPVVVVSHGL